MHGTRCLNGLLLTILLLAGARTTLAGPTYRRELRIPDIPGFVTLKCDLHMHTVFSDGHVWPTMRVAEAWVEGLDAIAITDHIEYLPHAKDIPAQDFNRSYELARGDAARIGLILIRGSEITRSMPPGHLNAIFLTDANPLKTEAWRDAIAAAHAQGAFIFWNHPGWRGQQADGVARWYAEHDELLAGGMLHGIEVVNSSEYYPQAQAWCLEHNLAMLANSDVHIETVHEYGEDEEHRRPMTLVFARERTEASIREALDARRTAVYQHPMLAGKDEFLRPIFERAVEIRQSPQAEITGDAKLWLQLTNRSSIPFELVATGAVAGATAPARILLKPDRTTLLSVAVKAPEQKGETALALPYRVENLKTLPDQGMPFAIPVAFTAR